MSNDFVSNGSRNATSDILIDGITTNEMVSGGLYTFATYTPSVDAVQEFKVQQSNFSAEYGFSGATLVNVVTRSGTNQIHGSGFEFLRNQKLDANNFFNNQNGIGLPALRQNNFGATVGGPISKNRTFFFADYEGTRIRSSSTVCAGVPAWRRRRKTSRRSVRTRAVASTPPADAPTQTGRSGVLLGRLRSGPGWPGAFGFHPVQQHGHLHQPGESQT